MSNDEYLRPTPVIITSNSYVWNLCPSTKGAILTRLVHFNDQLKTRLILENITKDLHPAWLNLFEDIYLNAEEKHSYSFCLPESDLYCEEKLDSRTLSPTQETTEKTTQTGLQYRPASPVSDFSDSPLPSPSSFSIDSEDSPFEVTPKPKKVKKDNDVKLK